MRFSKQRLITLINSDYLDKTFGFLIGIGGLNEVSMFGMLAWLGFRSREIWGRKSYIHWQDFIIVSASLLCISYWSINEIPGDRSGLTIVELTKAFIWTYFSLILIRAQKKMMFSVFSGIAFGLWLYAFTMLAGSLINLEFQGGRNMLYNIFTGSRSASSSITSYTCASSAMLFLGMASYMTLPAAITCILLGIHSVNRACILVGAAIFIYVSLARLNNVLLYRASRITRVSLIFIAIGVICMSATIFYHSDQFSTLFGVFRRLTTITTTDARLLMYSTGYPELLDTIISGRLSEFDNENIMALIKSKHGYVDWNVTGWHSLILDGARAGLLGLVASILWLCGIVFSIIQSALIRNLRLIAIGVIEICILLTSMPVALGHYELLGAFSVTTLLISAVKFKTSEEI